MGPAQKGRPHSSPLPPSRERVTDPAAPYPSGRCEACQAPRRAHGRWQGPIPQHSANHSRLLAPSRRRLCSGRRMACRCATCKAWLRCPWAVAGSRSHNTAPITLDSWLPRGVGFVPGTAGPAAPARRPRRELRSARRLEARPGPAGPAAPYTRPTPAQYGVAVLPCRPCSASVYITRPRPVSRPRPRR